MALAQRKEALGNERIALLKLRTDLLKEIGWADMQVDNPLEVLLTHTPFYDKPLLYI